MKKIVMCCVAAVASIGALAQNAAPPPAQSAQQQPDTRPRKPLPAEVQIQLLKRHDQTMQAVGAATAAEARAKDLAAQAQAAMNAYSEWALRTAQQYHCEDFDLSGDGVQCISGDPSAQNGAMDNGRPKPQAPAPAPPPAGKK